MVSHKDKRIGCIATISMARDVLMPLLVIGRQSTAMFGKKGGGMGKIS
jgi:hypothetical protein